MDMKKKGIEMAEQGGIRRKLDPRLAAIVSLSPAELAELHTIEEDAINDELSRLEDEREKRESQREFLQKQEDLDLFSVDDERSAVRGISRAARARLMQMAVQLHGIDFKEPEAPTASVFLKFRGDIHRIERLGATVRSVAGDIATATIPLNKVSELEEDDDILFIELSRPAFPDLDDSVPLIEANTHHGATPSVTGSGAFVGVIDYGLDFHHPDFRDPATGDTRVLWLWDQNPAGTSGTAGTAPAPWGYGLEYSRTDIDNDIDSVDPITGDPTPYSVVDHRAGVGAHGTHVAGIAAGNGSGDGVHIGVAPDADIIFVDTVGSGTLAVADLTQISDAVSYIFTKAGTTPCVVNLSLGDNLGPHDGTSLAEQFIDNMLVSPGRAVTIAAGNANQNGKHATGVVPNGGAQTSQIDVLATISLSRSESMEIWYDGHDLFDVTLTDPLGNTIGPVSPGATLASPLGTTNVTITSVQNDPRNNDNLISIVFQPTAGNRITPGAWQVQLSGNSGGSPSVVNGRWHGWIDRNTGTRMVWNAPTANNLTLGTPGTARRAITVGNHFKTGTPQALRGSSGRGPTRDGRIKPEVSAPGMFIEAPRSRNMTLLTPGVLYTSKSGTSMASPHVAGAVALLFECRGAGLSAADAKYILQRLVDTTGITSVPDLGFGWGRIRLANACAWAITGPDVWSKTNVADTGVESYTGPEAWRSPDIWVRPNRDGGTTHDNPEHGQENHVHVVARNRGAGPAYNTQVYLYWADPATNIPFSQWRRDGFRVGTEETNVQVIPELAAGANVQTPVPFSWFPPEPGSNIRGDDHFCLLARLENESDPSNVGPGGWSSIRDHNNIALKNVHIFDIYPDTTDADATFYVLAENFQTSLLIDTQKLPKRARPVVF